MLEVIFFTPKITPGLKILFSGLTTLMHNLTLPNEPNPIIIFSFPLELTAFYFDNKYSSLLNSFKIYYI